MIFATGDKHVPHDISGLNNKRWPLGNTLTKNDYLIIAGDFGLLWEAYPDNTEKYWTKWLQDKPWTTLFIDGNHENHYRLSNLHTQEMFGSEVGIVAESIYHLRRGHVYDIPNISTKQPNRVDKFFTFGGAESIDKWCRTQGISWWPEEIPNRAEFDRGWNALEAIDWKVDYIITHTCPTEVMPDIYANSKDSDPTSRLLQAYRNKLTFNCWYCAHFHEDRAFSLDTLCLFQKVHKIQ
ncbi:metallophosphatase [Patescibacteria group bacterium]|nr:metallophosphatase [Patescibacteria group bacterium]MBU0847165.1 metallophosphatase [Patescibacteria group bacterium]